MRSLRDKLKAVTSSKPKPEAVGKAEQDPFYLRQCIVPLKCLKGIEKTTLDEIRACDPTFAGTNWNYRKLLFLDTETTGLNGGAGTVAFEIGLGWIEPSGMIIRQYVMRDYHEEAAMLEEIASIFRRFDTVVSFNGKSFDLPLLESRMTMNRIRLPVTSWPHFDLLHAARRVYKLRIGRCNLSRLEAAIFGAEREDDLPGALVPQRYFDYLKTREFALLEDVLRHNKQDVQSLAELTGHLCEVFREPEKLAHCEDLFCVGRTLLRSGCTDKGRRCLKLVGQSPVSEMAYTALSLSYKKDRDWEHAVSSWHEMISHGEGGIFPYVELAKYYEHIVKDYDQALRFSQYALKYDLNHALLTGGDELQRGLLLKRIARLNKRLARK